MSEQGGVDEGRMLNAEGFQRPDTGFPHLGFAVGVDGIVPGQAAASGSEVFECEGDLRFDLGGRGLFLGRAAFRVGTEVTSPGGCGRAAGVDGPHPDLVQTSRIGRHLDQRVPFAGFEIQDGPGFDAAFRRRVGFEDGAEGLDEGSVRLVAEGAGEGDPGRRVDAERVGEAEKAVRPPTVDARQRVRPLAGRRVFGNFCACDRGAVAGDAEEVVAGHHHGPVEVVVPAVRVEEVRAEEGVGIDPAQIIGFRGFQKDVAIGVGSRRVLFHVYAGDFSIAPEEARLGAVGLKHEEVALTAGPAWIAGAEKETPEGIRRAIAVDPGGVVEALVLGMVDIHAGEFGS